MPSKSAVLIANKCEEFLSRPLSEDEMVKCEEIALNFYTRATVRYVEGLIKKKAPRDFDLVYQPIMHGVLRGAYRRMDMIYLKDRFKDVYLKVSMFCGDGMSDKELEAIIFMADDCSDKEIAAAIQAARQRGIHHACYIKAIIEGNRRVASRNILRNKADEKKRFIPDEHVFAKDDKKVPHVGAIRQAWKERLKKSRRKIALYKAKFNDKKNAD